MVTMSTLIVSHDLRLMMLEIAVEKLHVPRASTFDKAILRKTTVTFGLSDDDWTPLLPHRRDHYAYSGSNCEDESFHGGRSVVFAVPEASLENPVADVNVRVRVRRETSKYFEGESCQNVGLATVSADDLLNGIVKELRERKELADYLSDNYGRRPVSRSTRGVYELLDDDHLETRASIELYARITYLGDCLITEIDNPDSIRRAFYARDESECDYPYQFREVTSSQLMSGGWGSRTILPTPVDRDRLVCRCEAVKRKAGSATTDPAAPDGANGQRADRRDSVSLTSEEQEVAKRAAELDETMDGFAETREDNERGEKAGMVEHEGVHEGEEEDGDISPREKRRRERKAELEKYASEEKEQRRKLQKMLSTAKGRKGAGTVGIVHASKKICAPPARRVVCSPRPPCLPSRPCSPSFARPPCSFPTSCPVPCSDPM